MGFVSICNIFHYTQKLKLSKQNIYPILNKNILYSFYSYKKFHVSRIQPFGFHYQLQILFHQCYKYQLVSLI
jgi:hypothetical protein